MTGPQVILLSIVLAVGSFAAGWLACEWAEEVLRTALKNHTVIQQQIPQVP